MKPKLTRLALALLPLLHAGHAQTATVTWVGPDGADWSFSTHWSGGVFPTALDQVQLGSFNTAITTKAVAASVAGTGTLRIAGLGSLTLTGSSQLGGLTMEGGSLLGRGTTRVSGAGTLDLSSAISLTDHTLVLRGTTRARTDNVSASDNRVDLARARVVNAGTWLDQASGNTSFTALNALQSSLERRSDFDNEGTYIKEAATVTTFQYGAQFNNSGAVHVNAGTLRLDGGGNGRTGSFQVAEGATLDFANTTGRPFNTFLLGTAVTNAGTVTISGGVMAEQGLQVAGHGQMAVNRGGTLFLQAASSFGDLSVNDSGRLTSDSNLLVTGNISVNGGSLTLGSSNSFANLSLNGFASIGLDPSATLFVTGVMDWSSGGLLGTDSTLRSTGTLVLSGSASKSINGSNSLIAAGGTQQTGTGTLSISGSSSVQNLGTWSEQATGDNLISGFAGTRFDNPGTFNKDSASITTMGGHGLVFINTGTVNVNAGRLRLASSFNNQGLINIASGAELDGAHASFANAGTLAGSGTVRVLDTLTNTGTLAPGGVGQIGRLQVLGNLATSGNLNIELGRNEGDLLAVSGQASLGGTLNFSVLSGQRLERGSSFTVVSWGERSAGSEFASLNFSEASRYRFATEYGATGLSVTVTGLVYNWTGAAAGGFWDVVSNWNSGSDGRPQAVDLVLLGSADTRIRTLLSVADIAGTGGLALDFGANLTVGDSGSLGGLSMLQGQLTNNGRLVVTGATGWVNTQLRGSGITRLEGVTTIAGGDFDTTPVLRGGHTLELAGTTIFRHRRGLSVAEGATLINQGTWVDESPANVTVANVNGGTGRILNLGTFTKASATRTLIGEGTQLVFDNTGTLNVDAGYLRLSSSTVSSTGTVNIAAGAELSVASRDATLGGTVRNAGTLSLDSGVLVIAGDLVVQGNGLTRVASIVSNTNRLTFDGSVDWTIGTFTGSGTTRTNGAVTLSGSNGRTLSNGQTLELAGTTTQVGTGSLNTGGGARVLNLGSWVDAANGNVTLCNCSAGASTNSRFDNVGSFTKTSTGVTEIGSRLNFHNTGTLDIQAGTLRISDDATLMAGQVRIGNGGTPMAGQVRIASGATLSLAAGSIALSGTVQNAGTLALAGATVVVTDSTTVQGGLTTFRGAVANTGALQINGHVDWFEGDLRGSGTTRIDGTLALRGGNTRQLRNGQTLELTGTTTQIGTGGFQTGQGARLVNLGQWVDAANGNVGMINFNPTSAPGSRFDNVGTFTKTSAFTTTIGNGLVFNNTGTLDLQAGTLKFSERFNNQGLIRLAAGAELASEVQDFANAGILAGDGTVRPVFSFVALTNTGTLAAGGLDDAGTMRLLGGLTQGASGIFLVDLGSTAAGGFDLLTLSGTAALNGTLAVNLLDGAQFNVGDSFTVMTWNQRRGDSQFANLDLTQAEGYSFAAEYGANSLTLRVVAAPPVPEPESWALMALGLAGLAGWARRRAPLNPSSAPAS